MAEWLEAEDLYLIPSTHANQLSNSHNSSSRGSDTSALAPQVLALIGTYPHKDTHIQS